MLEAIRNNVGEWLRGGPQSDVVMSSRVRLARNIAGYPFLARSNAQDMARIEELLHNKIVSVSVRSDMVYVRLDTMSAFDRQLLVERHITAREHAEAPWVRGVAFDSKEELCLMVNEEDHLRMHALCGGFDLGRAFRDVCQADDAMAEVIPYAFSERYGYLTACPSNVGTGMRASAMCHLPALVMAGEMDKVIQLAGRRRLALRGRFGEGTHASADLYQVSNQITLGLKEEEILATVSEAVEALVGLEKRTREELVGRNRQELKGRLDLALELLGAASSITSEEALHLLSQVRLGVATGLVSGVTQQVLSELLLLTLPAHLQRIEGRRVDSRERNELRASYIKRRLGLN